jgi:phosphoribosylglycinamide formyltransferase-1
LLPAYRGLDTHERALADGARIHGCTTHFVIPELDAGPAIMQAALPVNPDDTAETLAERVLEQEHIIYPRTLALVASGDAKLVKGRSVILGARPREGAMITPVV